VVVACAVPFGLSAGAIDAALNAYAARHFGPRRINWMHAAYGLGAATSPMIVTVAVNSGAGWRAAYLAVMAVQGVLAMLFAASARAWNQAVVPSEPSVSRPRSRWRPRPRALAGVLLIFVESGLESVVGLWSYVFLLQAVTLAPATAGWVVSGYWAALVAGRVLLGSLAERLGTWPVLAGATIAVIVAAGTIASGQPLAAAAGVVLLGLAVAPVYPLLVLTTAERTMADSVDRLVGFQATASTLGSVSCAGAAGLILGADVTAFRFCALALALMTGAGTWFLAPGRHRGSGSGGRVR
jgi:fucose permease